jgi:murein L,D-transpeptidase YafK
MTALVHKKSGKLKLVTAALLLTSSMALAACTAEDALRGVGENRGEVPISKKIDRALKAKGLSLRAPIMVRIFKTENVLEVWKQKPNGRYTMLADFEICKWSGKLGPKFKEGDRQAPEGFYSVAPHQMNPRSSYHLSFNMGFPNRFDQSLGRTGTHLMIHGDCSSAGCYSMTDSQVEDIYALAREALRGGQTAFQIQAFPFRMTPENMAKHKDSEHFEFWQNIKIGYDHFELTKKPPSVEICERTYQFNKDFGDQNVSATQACPQSEMSPSLLAAYQTLSAEEAEVFDKLAARYDAKQEQELEKAAREQAEKEAAALREQQVAAQQAVEPAQDVASAPVPVESPTAEAGSNAATSDVPLPASAPGSESNAANDTSAAPAETAPERRGLFGRVRGLFGS